MLGVGRRKQIRQQKEMVENAAKINYKYGEMAAENAFERQQVLYNRTYQDQSYASQAAQMDAAGLSPGLMYGKGGAGGGGAGSTTGAPMGATGATGAGTAADPNMQLQALMSLRQVRMTERKNEAEINLLNTQAEALEAGEDFLNPISGIAGDISGILNTLGIGRRKQIRQQKEMAENAAQINYKYGEMAARNAFERQQVLYNRTYQDQSYASQVAPIGAPVVDPAPPPPAPPLLYIRLGDNPAASGLS